MALIYGKAAFTKHGRANPVNSPHWMLISQEPTTNYEPSNELLGVICLLGDKEQYREISEIASNAGEWSTPVFDSNGTVRYPLQKTKEDQIVSEIDNKK